MTALADIDPARFPTRWFEGRGFAQAYVRQGEGGVPLLLIHGWPETKRIWWRVIEPLAVAGFDVIAPDLRGYGESEVGPDGYHDAPASSRDLEALLRALGLDAVVVAGGDFGGVVAQDLALRFPDLVDRMVVFNSPLPYDRERMAGLRTMAASTYDYFLRQGLDADALAVDLATEEQRRRYVAGFYSSRLWAHPGAFTDEAIAFHTEPFADGRRLRASFGAYESVFSERARSEPLEWRPNDRHRAVVLFGPSDHVSAPDFDRMAELVFSRIVGPFLVRDCGHFLQWEAASVLVRSLVGFCPDRLPASS